MSLCVYVCVCVCVSVCVCVRVFVWVYSCQLLLLNHYTHRWTLHIPVCVILKLIYLPFFPRTIPGLYPIFCSSAKPLLSVERAVFNPSVRFSFSRTFLGFTLFFSLDSLCFLSRSISFAVCDETANPGLLSSLWTKQSALVLSTERQTDRQTIRQTDIEIVSQCGINC